MLFSELAHAIHPYLMKDADVPGFMRDLIQRLCDIPEEDWYTKRDPSSDEKYKDGSLRKFYSKGPTKKLAKAMLGRLTRDNFTDSISSDDYATDVGTVKRESLVRAVKPFADNENDVTEENVAEILFDLFKLSLEYIVNPDLENDRKLKRAETDSEKAKRIYGAALLEDCKHICSKPGCSAHLQTVASNHQSRNDYEVVCISSEKKEYDNLIALCHGCFNSYILKHTKAEEKELLSIKALQRQISDARQTLRTTDIETGIRKVVENFSRAKGEDFLDLNYDPVAVPEKIDGQTDFFLLDEVMRNVTRYYLFIEKTMQDLAKEKVFNDELLRAQIKASYKKLEDKKLEPDLIYQMLSERLHQITKQDIRYCTVVICYFIQSCEVFNAIA